MSLDARTMLEVNSELIASAARAARDGGESCPLVVSVATWGRGCRQEVLQALEPYRRGHGHNGSVVATPPRELAARLFGLPALLEAADGRYLALGIALGKSHQELRSLGAEEKEGLF